ncbi:uncharacterized protein K452DRAFT_283644 [Aplosporella prunicola CBS 121167]|uniref:Peptidase A1 domain-containing protein n=1 Tax=Aplosporella prunicola CBS 121167 TaxID=1176127 RepID=A0A6A6BUN3_9PEZI|nr:uncharacterized protein K452DRAFT_283644 [Aplosporella prunicola CBS 121167]KAF2146371.1 hypothetical protein K452DRAFT_283644 [Aplosporella prunicola CBS 121167]
MRTVFFTALLGLISFADTKPLEKRNQGVTLSEEPAGRVARSGPLELEKLFKRYNAPAPAHVRRAAKRALAEHEKRDGGANGSVVATPQAGYDIAYMVPVTVGNKKVHLKVDTGSSDFWALSTLIPSADAGTHNLYEPSSSRVADWTWGTHYLDGSYAEGVVYEDKVELGSLTFEKQVIEAANMVSDKFTDSPYDGLMGMAFDKVNTVKPVKQQSFFNNIKTHLPQALFTANLKKGAAGSYTFGTINPDEYTGDISYVPVDASKGLWEFTTDGYSVGNNGSATNSSASWPGIMDTGSSLLTLPADVVRTYYAAVPGAVNSPVWGAWVFPCDTVLPAWSAVIGGKTATVPGAYINYAPVDAQTCFGGIQENHGMDTSIYGDIFIKSQFVVFDQTQATPRIGLARQSGVVYPF